jgi:hypothetical protein
MMAAMTRTSTMTLIALATAALAGPGAAADDENVAPSAKALRSAPPAGTSHEADYSDPTAQELVERRDVRILRGPASLARGLGFGLTLKPAPAEPGIDDRNALSEGLRSLQVDAAGAPISFSRVYRMPAMGDRFVRGNGALYAVFPYSQYKRVEKNKVKGIEAMVPSGTVFMIGAKPEWFIEDEEPTGQAGSAGQRMEGDLPGSAPPGSASLAAQLRKDYRRVEIPRPPRGEAAIARAETRIEPRDELARSAESRRPTPLGPRFVQDEQYRRAFFAALLEREDPKAVPPTEPASAAPRR